MRKAAWRRAIAHGEAASVSDIPYTPDTARQMLEDATRTRTGFDPIDPDVLPF